VIGDPIAAVGAIASLAGMMLFGWLVFRSASVATA
jgi:hypothetical protein